MEIANPQLIISQPSPHHEVIKIETLNEYGVGGCYTALVFNELWD